MQIRNCENNDTYTTVIYVIMKKIVGSICQCMDGIACGRYS